MGLVLGSEGLTPEEWAEAIGSRLVADESTGCLRWPDGHTGEGYGTIQVNGRPAYVHRLTYEALVGPIPEGLVIDHVRARGCVHRDCSNRDHLEPVTRGENANVRGRWADHAPTHCAEGHPLVEGNLYQRRNGRPRCRTCRLDYANRYYAERVRPAREAARDQ